MSGWSYLESHPAHYHDPLPDVAKIAQEEWLVLSYFCNLNEVDLHVYYDADFFENTNSLAAAYRLIWFIDGKWKSGALNRHGEKGRIVIRVNPNVPNGWYNDDGSCNTGYRFDMRTMIRHELLHGIGITSSIREDSVGYTLPHTSICALPELDEHMHTADGGPYLSGCSFTETRMPDAFVSDVQLFNPFIYMPGSSFHHTAEQGILYYAMRPGVCMQYDQNALTLLNEIGAECQSELLQFRSTRQGMMNFSATVRNINLFVYIMFMYMIKCLMIRSMN